VKWANSVKLKDGKEQGAGWVEIRSDIEEKKERGWGKKAGGGERELRISFGYRNRNRESLIGRIWRNQRACHPISRREGRPPITKVPRKKKRNGGIKRIIMEICEGKKKKPLRWAMEKRNKIGRR